VGQGWGLVLRPGPCVRPQPPRPHSWALAPSMAPLPPEPPSPWPRTCTAPAAAAPGWWAPSSGSPRPAPRLRWAGGCMAGQRLVVQGWVQGQVQGCRLAGGEELAAAGAPPPPTVKALPLEGGLQRGAACGADNGGAAKAAAPLALGALLQLLDLAPWKGGGRRRKGADKDTVRGRSDSVDSRKGMGGLVPALQRPSPLPKSATPAPAPAHRMSSASRPRASGSIACSCDSASRESSPACSEKRSSGRAMRGSAPMRSMSVNPESGEGGGWGVSKDERNRAIQGAWSGQDGGRVGAQSFGCIPQPPRPRSHPRGPAARGRRRRWCAPPPARAHPLRRRRHRPPAPAAAASRRAQRRGRRRAPAGAVAAWRRGDG
jgi:hypothetical protein